MTETYNFVFCTVEILLLELAQSFSTPARAKIQDFVHLNLNSTLQLINSNSSDLRKLLRYFISTAIVAFI